MQAQELRQLSTEVSYVASRCSSLYGLQVMAQLVWTLTSVSATVTAVAAASATLPPVTTATAVAAVPTPSA